MKSGIFKPALSVLFLKLTASDSTDAERSGQKNPGRPLRFPGLDSVARRTRGSGLVQIRRSFPLGPFFRGKEPTGRQAEGCRKTCFQKESNIQNHKNQDKSLIFIPRPAPTGSGNGGIDSDFSRNQNRIQGDWVPLEACRKSSTRSSGGLRQMSEPSACL